MRIKLCVSLLLCLGILIGCPVITVFAEPPHGTPPANYCESSDKTRSIEYIPKANGYYLKNIPLVEFRNAFATNSNIEKASSEEITVQNLTPQPDYAYISHDILSVRLSDDLLATKRTYEDQYKMTYYFRGLFGENIPITYTMLVKFSTVMIQGKEYVAFVSILLGPTYSMPSNIYKFSSTGTSSPIATIKHSGATLEIKQIIQLETTVGYSLSISVSPGWVSAGSAGSGQYYFRSEVRTCITTSTLPIYNLIY